MKGDIEMRLLPEEQESLLNSFVEIKTPTRDDFNKIKETLTRIGLFGGKDINETPILWQSCHIFQKQGRYFIVHFKQLFLLDGKSKTVFSEEDQRRTIKIAQLLEDWGMIEIISKYTEILDDSDNVTFVIVPHKNKHRYVLAPKYTIGNPRLTKTGE